MKFKSHVFDFQVLSCPLSWSSEQTLVQLVSTGIITMPDPAMLDPDILTEVSVTVFRQQVLYSSVTGLTSVVTRPH